MKLLLRNEYTIALLAALLFIPFLGNVHLFDWDEINFAESAREMLATGDYFSVQINYTKFTEKPPLFFWLQVLAMKAFGINEFAARFPNAICGIVTLVLLFRIGKKLFNEQLGRIWVMIYLGTLLTFLYFKSGIIDPWFNLFIFLGIYQFHYLTVNTTTNRIWRAIWAGTFLGLAVLTKGPVAILVSLLAYLTYVVTHRFQLFLQWKELLLIIISAFVVCFAWFGVDLLQNGPKFLIEFTERQIAIFSTSDAGHGQPFFYHWVVLLIGCFPASIFFIKGMWVRTEHQHEQAFKQWMVILFWVHLLLFSIVKTKIVHYSSLCWFPLTFLAALAVQTYWRKENKFLTRGYRIAIGTLGLLLGIIFTALPFIMMQKDAWVHLVDDVFARGNLAAQVSFSWLDGIGGYAILGATLYFFVTRNKQLATQLLFVAMGLCCFITSAMLAPKVEAISQRANIEFFEARQNEDCYVETWGYKSYAHYFYTLKKPFSNDSARNVDWLINSNNVDKPTYISIKIQDASHFDTLPTLQKLYAKNGFVFYKRK